VISREAEFVVGVVSAYVSGAKAEEVAGLAARDLDWDLAVRIATWHAVAPIMYRVLSVCPESVPPAIFANLRQRFRANTMRNTYLARELVRITNGLREKGVRAIALKGPVLAQVAYGDLGLRQFIDLDILVHPSDLGVTRDVLAATGYNASSFAELGGQERKFFQWNQEKFGNADWSIHVDVHWQLNPHYFEYAPEGDALWRRAPAVELQGAIVDTLSTQDLLLHLCVHGAKHAWTSLAWILDLAALISCNPGLDWPAIVAQANSQGGQRLLLLGLYLAHDLLGGAVPGNLIALGGNDRMVVRVAAEVKRRMFGNIGERANVVQEWIVPTLAIESVRGRIRYVAGRALAPTIDDWRCVQLPRPLFALYYMLHPVRLAFMQGPRLLRALLGRHAPDTALNEGAF
jgi:hypothetical protein